MSLRRLGAISTAMTLASTASWSDLSGPNKPSSRRRLGTRLAPHRSPAPNERLSARHLARASERSVAVATFEPPLTVNATSSSAFFVSSADDRTTGATTAGSGSGVLLAAFAKNDANWFFCLFFLADAASIAARLSASALARSASF